MEMEPVPAKTPKAIKKLLLADERVLASIQQSRLKAPMTPDTIVVTNHRIIRISPSALGLHKEIMDYRYEDMANFKVNKGVIFASIRIKHRLMNEELVIDNLVKSSIDEVSKIVMENIGRIRNNSISQPISSAQPDDPLEVLRLRFAKGEVTKEQYEEMKRALQ